MFTWGESIQLSTTCRGLCSALTATPSPVSLLESCEEERNEAECRERMRVMKKNTCEGDK